MTRRCSPIDDPFRTRFIQLRHDKNLTQKQVGDAVGLSPITISGWEIGKSMPDAQTLPLLADILDVTIDFLLGRAQPTTLEPNSQAAFVPVFGGLRFLHGKLICIDHQGSHPVPSTLQNLAGPGGLLFVAAPDTALQDALIRPGDLVALYVRLPFKDNELCGVMLGPRQLRLLRVTRLVDGYKLCSEDSLTPPMLFTGPAAKTVHVIGPYAGSWSPSPIRSC